VVTLATDSHPPRGRFEDLGLLEASRIGKKEQLMVVEIMALTRAPRKQVNRNSPEPEQA